MLDCGMHPGFSDMRKFPDFTYLKEEAGGNLDSYLTVYIILLLYKFLFSTVKQVYLIFEYAR